MIYDDKTLSKLTREQLEAEYKKLSTQLTVATGYLTSPDTRTDFDHWAYEVSSTAECLKQVRNHLMYKK